MPEIVNRKTVFSTKWFELMEKQVRDGEKEESFYSVNMDDYVNIIALTCEREIILVRQYRPAIEDISLELPAGHVDPGEEPAEAALRELAEETGFHGESAVLLGCLNPDTGRLSNRQWCFFVDGATPCSPAPEPEPGVEKIICSLSEFSSMIADGSFPHALHLAAVLLAVRQRLLVLPEPA